MSIRGKAFIAGAYEYPRRDVPDRSTPQLYADVSFAALADAGLSMSDVDGLFCDSSAPGGGPMNIAEYLGISPRYADGTETGGSTYLVYVAHAAEAIAAGDCHVALIPMADRPRHSPRQTRRNPAPEANFEDYFGVGITANNYAMVAMRHMYEFGTTPEQLAEVKVAASLHAQYNPHAFLPKVVTVEEVLESPMISDPLHRLDCCVTTDGGGALVVVSEEVARQLDRRCAKVLGHGMAFKDSKSGRPDFSHTGAVWSAPLAYEEAGVTPGDIDYASIYDSFTITVIETLEDLGFCEKGEGGRFVSGGTIVAPYGQLPINTDGGGLCNNHPGGRGGMPRTIEAVRQVRGEANPEVQVPDVEFALVHGTGGRLASRSAAATLILGQEDA